MAYLPTEKYPGGRKLLKKLRKPEECFLQKSEGKEVAKLMDFLESKKE